MIAVPLSHRLRAETREAHTAAERSGIMRALLRGTVGVSSYYVLLVNLAALYQSMEVEIERNRDHEALRGVDWSRLRRFPSLQHDIEQLRQHRDVSENVAAHVHLAPTTLEYQQRLRELGTGSPELLFAHAYLRYLGDMYGGQIIKRIVLEKIIPDSSAVTFYEFQDVGNLHEFMVTFRESLDRVARSPEDADRIVQEAQLGYEMHARLFEELAGQTAGQLD